MRVMIIGATGTIGSAVLTLLKDRYETIAVSHRKGRQTVDIGQPDSIRTLFQSVGRVDAVVCTAGVAVFKRMDELTDADFAVSIGNKLMGQVNVVRIGAAFVEDGGSITLTSGILSREPMVGSAAISLVNAGLEGFVRAAALELPRRIRLNVVSPGWVTETLEALQLTGIHGTPASKVAEMYVHSVEGGMTGAVIDAKLHLHS